MDKDTDYDFCMCNPPFFHDAMDREGERSNRTGMRPSPPNPSSSKATDHETLTEGGEVQFVGQILAESLKLRTKIRYVHTYIYTLYIIKGSRLRNYSNAAEHIHKYGIAQNFGRVKLWRIDRFKVLVGEMLASLQYLT